MIGMGFDPEVPAGYQDADIEMAELREAAIQAEAEAKTEEERKPFECPECGNTDKEEMNLILVDDDYVRYNHTTDVENDEGVMVPTFSYSKSVYSCTSDHHEPSMECRAQSRDEEGILKYCYAEWDIRWEDFDLE